MAALNAMHTMFVRIGFTNAAAQVIVEEQRMDVLDKIQLLTDDESKNLCKFIRRPGGVIPGSNPGNPPVNNPGTPINLHATYHLKLIAFYLRHEKRISNVVNVAKITLDSIHTLRELRDYESSYKAADNPPTINAKDWPKKSWKVSRNISARTLENRKYPCRMLSGRMKTFQASTQTEVTQPFMMR